jgi:ComF family protein
LVEDSVSLFFPRYCAGCEDALVKGEELVCTKCLLEMPKSNYHLDPENAFYRKLKGRIDIRFVLSFFKFTKAGKVQHLLHALKYKNKPELGVLLGAMYGSDLKKAGFASEFDMIVPVPLHTFKKRRRGYNQSEEFGKGLSAALEIPCISTGLERKYMTTTQTRKTRLKRWQNVRDVFSVSEEGEIAGKRVLLIDDVVTTGATLEAAGKVILDAGCSQLSFGCIAATE